MAFACREIVFLPLDGVNPLTLHREQLLTSIWHCIPEYKSWFSKYGLIIGLKHNSGDNTSENPLVSGRD